MTKNKSNCSTKSLQNGSVGIRGRSQGSQGKGKDSALQPRMVEDMQLHGLAQSTQEKYVRGANSLASYYGRPLDKITQEEVRKFFLYLKTKKKVSPSILRAIYYGVRFFYEKTLNQKWNIFDIIKPVKTERLPVILSFGEVKKTLAQLYHPTYRMCLTMIYSCGLRVSEGTNLRVDDIDGERLVVKIIGKGNKMRYAPLPELTKGPQSIRFATPMPLIYWRKGSICVRFRLY